ncbi:hypothetical protein D3C81_1961220 [compost metagenome]
MAQTVGDNPILFSHQGRNQRLIGGKTGNKQQRAGIAEPVSKGLFQRLMRGGVARHMPRPAAADAPGFRPLLPGANDRRMLAQAEIIVA